MFAEEINARYENNFLSAIKNESKSRNMEDSNSVGSIPQYSREDDPEQELLKSPTWNHRKLNIDILPFKKDVQFDNGIKKLQKKATKIGPIQKLNMYTK